MICTTQELGVAEGVGEAVGGDRVLDVAGVADQRPPGPGRSAEEPGPPPGEHPEPLGGAGVRVENPRGSLVQEPRVGGCHTQPRFESVPLGEVPAKTQVWSQLVGKKPAVTAGCARSRPGAGR